MVFVFVDVVVAVVAAVLDVADVVVVAAAAVVAVVVVVKDVTDVVVVVVVVAVGDVIVVVDGCFLLYKCLLGSNFLNLAPLSSQGLNFPGKLKYKSEKIRVSAAMTTAERLFFVIYLLLVYISFANLVICYCCFESSQ